MKSIKIYYIVDNVAENVSGVFTAVNDDMAKRQFSAFIDKLPEIVKEADYCLVSGDSFTALETYDEVNNSNLKFVCNGSEFVREKK